MGPSNQVFVDLAFQRRLRKTTEIFQAELYVFIEMLEKHGMMVVGVPRYTVPVHSGPNAKGRIEFLLKVMGVWTTLWLEQRHTGVFVLYDRSG